MRMLWVGLPFALVCLDAATAASPVEDLLQKNCGDCHSSKIHSSGFSVATLGDVIQGGRVGGIGSSFDSDHVSGLEGNAAHGVSRASRQAR